MTVKQNTFPGGTLLYDVILHGYVVPLKVLKSEMRKLKITQGDLVLETGFVGGEYDEQTILSQASISKQLRGERPMDSKLLAALSRSINASVVATWDVRPNPARKIPLFARSVADEFVARVDEDGEVEIEDVGGAGPNSYTHYDAADLAAYGSPAGMSAAEVMNYMSPDGNHLGEDWEDRSFMEAMAGVEAIIGFTPELDTLVAADEEADVIVEGGDGFDMHTGGKVIDLMEALETSLARQGPSELTAGMIDPVGYAEEAVRSGRISGTKPNMSNVPKDAVTLPKLSRVYPPLDAKELVTHGGKSGTEPVADVLTLIASQFPLERAQKVAEMARKARSKSEVKAQFSMRKLKLWGEGYYLLLAAGFDTNQALAGAYHVAAVAKTLPNSEDRDFLVNAFEVVFGFEPKLPVVNANKARADGNRHPMDYITEVYVRAGIPTWIVGDSATGKTHSIRDILRRLGREYIRIQGSDDTHENDFMGSKEALNGSTFHRDGPLPLCAAGGKTLIVDECSAIPSRSLIALQAVLEGEPVVIKSDGGRVVERAGGFSIVVTDNTRGLGEGLEYVGTEVVNASILDRFVMIEQSYLPPSQESLAISEHLKEVQARLV